MLSQLSCLECIRTDTNSKVLYNADCFFKTWECISIWWTVCRLTLISGYTWSVSIDGNRSDSNRIMHTLSLLQKSRKFFSPPPPTWTRILCLRLGFSYLQWSWIKTFLFLIDYILLTLCRFINHLNRLWFAQILF